MISDDRRTWHVDLTPKYSRSDIVGKKPFIDEKRRKHCASDVPIMARNLISLSHTNIFENSYCAFHNR